MWGVLFAQVGYNWGLYILIASGPTYLYHIHHFGHTKVSQKYFSFKICQINFDCFVLLIILIF